LNQQAVLKSLEGVLESFLEQVVSHKQPRLQVLEGINRLDDIARTSDKGLEITDSIGDWFAANNPLLSESRLRPADISRIGMILNEIKGRLDLGDEAAPATQKISSEIDRWRQTGTGHEGRKIVLRRGPETAAPTSRPHFAEEADSIDRFRSFFERARNLFEDFAGNQKHLLSALDDSLSSAAIQRNRDALILSSFIIYYLKQNGYKVDPYVQRLRKAQELLKGHPHVTGG